MALTIYTPEALSKLPFLEQVDVLKKQVDSLRPLPKEIEDRVLQKLRLEWNYHSNAIEGNQLSYGETVAFIMEGITAKGKTLKDHLDIKGHDEAIKYLLDIVKNADYVLNEADIRNLHQLLLKENYFVDAQTPSGEKTRKEIKIGQYKSSPNHVLTATGETHYYASPEQVPMRMGDLMDWYKEAKENKSVHPVVLATLFHHEFTAIHPFDDGNGRMGRLLLNLMLLQNGYPPIVVKQNDKLNYYQVLRQADAGEMVPINEYMSTLVEHSLNIYIKAANGESIEEEDDIDKEIALFKKGLSEDIIKYKNDSIYIEKAIKETIVPFFNMLFLKLNKFDDLFVEIKKVLRTEYMGTTSGYVMPSQDFGDPDTYFIDRENMYFGMHKNEITALNYDVDSFNIEIKFDGYKKNKIPYSIALKYIVSFNKYNYSVGRQTYPIAFQEIYGQNLIKDKITKLVNQEVQFFMQELKNISNG